MDTVPVPMTVEELQQALQIKYNTSWQNIADMLTSYNADPTDFETLAELCNLQSITSQDGNTTMWLYGDLVDDISFTPNPSVSTDSYTTVTHVRTPMNTSIDDVTGKVNVTNTPKTGSFAQNASYVMGEVGQAASIVSVGTWLGKQLSNAIYENAPNYFPDIDWSNFNPERWASITNGDDSFGAQLFNFVFGIDPDTNKAQAYIDADAAAYLAYALYKQDWFSEYGFKPSENFVTGYQPTVNDFQVFNSVEEICDFYEGMGVLNWGYYPSKADFVQYLVSQGWNNYQYILCWEGWNGSLTGFYAWAFSNLSVATGTLQAAMADGTRYGPRTTRLLQNALVYYPSNRRVTIASSTPSGGYIDLYTGEGVSYTGGMPCIMMGEISEPPEGISTQTGAQLPDTSTWADIPSTDTYLRNAYPDTYNNAIQYDALQPDGSVLTKTYIPVPFPENLTSPNQDTSNDPWNNPQPTTDGANQTDPLIDLLTGPAEFIKELIKTITQTEPDTNLQNPTTTGTGETPTLTPIAGSSTALWSVYNPTKSQIDSFGSWLWTDNVIQQFIQLLNNPMEGIITLHKVFATPVISGTGTIVVGRLDSGVGSNLVAQQYVNVDCGSVTLDEYFGNVFDYSPHTTISLYLPFIGFVPLNVDDVMRSTISITYGVDVFTGACLATVNVDRDGNSVGLYQYSGVASVEYPLTGAQHGGLVNGLLGVAGGVAGIALASTGVGVVAGASAIAGGLTNAAKTSNARSGGFSGNAGAMGVKIPYLIIERPITKVANTFDVLNGYPTNHDSRLGDCSGNVIVKYVHVEGINATEQELSLIESMLKSGVVV